MPKKCSLWRAMTECSCDVGGVRKMGRNWCGMAAELVIGFTSSQTSTYSALGWPKAGTNCSLRSFHRGVLDPRGSKLSGCSVS